jgi:hypothetical protein
VVGVVGVDGSPSCGIHRALNVGWAVDGLATLRPGSETRDQANAAIRASVAPGQELFIAALRAGVARRNLAVPFLAHDLLAKLDGTPSSPHFDDRAVAGR